MGDGVGALIGGATSLFGGLMGSNSANQAAQAQVQAANIAAQTQMNMFNRTQENLAPFIGAGQQGTNMLMGRLPELTRTFNPTMEELAATPGYQWALNQGLQATQNSYASQGLANSGPALKGAARFAEGLASQTYQQQLQNFLGQNLQQYNMLMGPSQMGANAAAGLGGIAQQTGANIGQTQIGAGSAQAAGAIGAGNAWTNAAAGMGQYAMLNSLMNSGGGGNTFGANMNLLGSSGGANSGNNWSIFGNPYS